MLTILGEERQAHRVVRQHGAGHLGNAREDLANVEHAGERPQQRIEPLQARRARLELLETRPQGDQLRMYAGSVTAGCE